MEQDTAVVTEPQADSWPTLDTPPPAADAAKRAGVLKGVGILATGLVAGAIGVATIHGSQGSATTANGNGPGGFRNAQGGPPGFQGQGGFQGGPPGGLGQGQTGGAVTGTVASIGTSGLTLTGANGGSTAVTVSGATVVTLNGAASTLAALRSGDTVQAVVGTDGTATQITATGPART